MIADTLSRRADYIEELELEPATLLKKEVNNLVFNKLNTYILATIEVKPIDK